MSVVQRFRWPIRLGVAALAVAWVFMPVVAPAQTAPAPAEPVALTARIAAESTSSVLADLKDLDAAKRRSTVDYIVGGSEDNRTAFVNGDVDLITSGVDFTAAQRAALEQSGRGVIAAPIQAVGMQLFGFVPQLQIFPTKCDELNPDTGEPVIECTLADRRDYKGDVRFSPQSMISIFYQTANVWNSPQFLSDLTPLLPPGYRLISPIRGARPVVRSDGDSYNQYLDAYLALTAAKERAAALTGVPGSDPNAPPGETFPGLLTPSRQGMDNVVATVREGLDPASSEKSAGGSLAAALPSGVDESFTLNDSKPLGERTPLYRAQVRNGAGEWVAASPAGISTAIAAGNGTPLAGAADKVPGAYPLSWVTNAYVPARGLTADEANAAAAFIRVQVTKGRARAASFGDGQLTDALVGDALRAANRIVESNCAAAKGTVVDSADGAPWVPAGTVTSGPVKVCEAAPSAPTTTEAPATASFDESASADFSSDLSSDSFVTDVPAGFDPLAPAQVAGETAVASPSESSGARPSASGRGRAGGSSVATKSVSRRMPLPIPGESLPPLDRAVTLGLGALTFVGLWNLYERRRSSW